MVFVGGFCAFCFNLRAALTAGDEGLGLAVGFGFLFLVSVFDLFGPTLTSLKVNEVDLTKCHNTLTYTDNYYSKNHFFVADGVLFLKWCCP